MLHSIQPRPVSSDQSDVLVRDELEAELRARELWQHVLTKKEREEIQRRGYLELASRIHRCRAYRIYQGGDRRVRVYLKLWFIRLFRGELCINPVVRVPPSDKALMHKLQIEGNEAEYLRIAKFFRLKIWLQLPFVLESR